MLRYVVQRAIEGQTDHLKERTLGVAVFGRDPAYDTNLDPVVRVTAGEIRKRIAQYYHEPGHEAEIRIDFPPGSYLPEFHVPQVASVAVLPAVPPVVVRKKVSRVMIAGSGCAVILAAVLLFKSGVSAAPIDRFWEPVLKSTEPVLVYVGASYPEAPLEAAVTMTDLHKAERVGFADAEALANLTAYLATKKKAYRLRLQEDGQLNELKEGPSGINWSVQQQLHAALDWSHALQFRASSGFPSGWNPRSAGSAEHGVVPVARRPLHGCEGRLCTCVAGLGFHHGTGGCDSGRPEQVRNRGSRRISQYAQLYRTNHTKRAKGLGSQEYRVGHRD